MRHYVFGMNSLLYCDYAVEQAIPGVAQNIVTSAHRERWKWTNNALEVEALVSWSRSLVAQSPTFIKQPIRPWLIVSPS